MDLPGAKPPDEIRLAREATSQPTAPNAKTSQGLIEQAVSAPSEIPDSGGVVASSQAESGSVRDHTEPKQTPDNTTLADLIKRITRTAGGVGATRLAIEVDSETSETRFLILSKETGEVLRTVPNEDILPMLRKLADQGGVVVNRSM